MITIIDYKVGNLGSIYNMFKKIGIQSEITSEKSKIERASKLILPGVGSFDSGMRNLNDLHLVEVLKNKIQIEKVPVLGICLGMQLLTNFSEEGSMRGLSIVDGCVRKFKFEVDSPNKVPHMGWNYVHVEKQSNLFSEMYEEPKFYFVHSYYVEVIDSKYVLTKTNYGIDFCSGFENENIYGVQFHPEKSHKYGKKLLQNFAQI